MDEREGKAKEGIRLAIKDKKLRQKRERVVERCQEDICEMYHQVTRGIVVGNLEVDYCVFFLFAFECERLKKEKE